MLEQYIQLDANHHLTLQDQIKSGITQAIANGFINTSMPITSSRKLAQDLKVSRNTVLRVYDQLSEDGFLISKERKGYFVNPDISVSAIPRTPPVKQTIDWNHYIQVKPSWHQEAPRDLKNYPYLFVHGMMDHSLFPVNEWRKCSIQSLNKTNSKQWTSSDNDYDDLVEQIRTRVLPRRGIYVQSDEIMVTIGSQQSLNLIAKLLTSDTSTIGIENPGYPEAWAQFESRKARLQPLDVDDQGLVIGELLNQCDIVYTTPSNQFPTTVRLSSERRKKLVEASEQHNFLIVEDDFEHEVCFIEENTFALKGEYSSERIIYLSSFSSTIAPGLRIGFIVAAPEFIKRAKHLQRLSHTYPPKNNCHTLALFISLGYYDALMQRRLKKLRSKWLTMEKALNYYFPQSGVVPSLAGTSFWLNYDARFDANTLYEKAEQIGILINPGDQYYIEDDKKSSFRLSFSSIEESDIREGIRRLSEVAREILPLEHIADTHGQQLSGSEIRKLFDHHTVLTSDCFNIPYRIEFQPDGRMYGVSDRPNDEDEGYWWVEGNTMFYQWKTWQFADIREVRLVLDGHQLKRFDRNGFCVNTGKISPSEAW
ncbi:PLP-dependent aminotransferase family protein [Vibrio cionasavignyae]|uniref:MocR-like pyridoxine biosynthesis transcription factor PdxR n=1 Tax=Vibrio cionasavignyae TaxID=2910252 RepID=UPI003D0A39F9